MSIRLLFLLFSLLLSQQVFPQDLVSRLEKALSNKGSAEYIFETERTHLETRQDYGMYFYYLGRYETSTGERRKALESYQKALEYFKLDQEPSYFITAYNHLTYLESILGDWEKALMYGQKALESAKIVK